MCAFKSNMQVFLYWFLFGAAAASGQRTESILLKPGQEISGLVARGTVRQYRVAADTGLRLEIGQVDSDLLIEIRDTKGHLLRTVDGFDYGLESASLDPSPNRLAVRVRKASAEGPAASYRLRLVSFPDAAARDLRRKAEDASSRVQSLRSRRGAEALREAVEEGVLAANLWRQTGDTGYEARAILSLADTHHALNQYQQARDLYAVAIPLSRAAGDRHTEAACLNNRGIGYWQQGSFSEAIADLGDALKIYETLPLMAGRAAALNNLGLLSWQVGEYQDALVYYERAMLALRPLGNQRGHAFVLGNVALTQAALGEYQKSIPLFRQTAAAFGKLSEPVAAGRALSAVSRVYMRVGNPHQAEASVRRSIALIEPAGDQRALAESLNLLGEVCAATARQDEALDLQRRAVDLFRKMGDARGEANALTNIGLTLVAQGKRSDGIAQLREALALHQKIGTPASEAAVWRHLAIAQRDEGNLTEAHSSIESAIAISEKIRGNVSAEDLRISYLASTHDYYSAYIGILMRQAAATRDPAFAVQAWQVAERSRARALVEALDGGRPASSPANRTLLEEIRDLRSRINSESAQLMRDARGGEERRRRLDDLLSRWDRLEETLRTSDHRYSDLTNPLPPTLAGVQSQILDPATALLEYAVGDDTSYLWVIRQDSFDTFLLPGRTALEREARNIAASMPNPQQRTPTAETGLRFRRAVRALSAALIVPALPRLTARRLLIIPMALLPIRPFAALPLPAARPGREVRRWSSCPSISTLSRCGKYLAS